MCNADAVLAAFLEGGYKLGAPLLFCPWPTWGPSKEKQGKRKFGHASAEMSLQEFRHFIAEIGIGAPSLADELFEKLNQESTAKNSKNKVRKQQQQQTSNRTQAKDLGLGTITQCGPRTLTSPAFPCTCTRTHTHAHPG